MQAAPLSPARALLAQAIEALNEAHGRLHQAQNPASETERIRAAASCREAAELRAAIQRLRSAHEAELAAWVDAGADGVRPMAAGELLDAERRLGGIAGAAGAAEAQVSLADEGYAGAAARVHKAAEDRDRTLWPAAVEAAGPVLDELGRAVTAVLGLEARLRSLVSALREAGNRDAVNGNGALAAASSIESGIQAARRLPALARDAAPGRSLIERLRSDARATL
jgi:hypothetical protein